jgi:hypothetical protein
MKERAGSGDGRGNGQAGAAEQSVRHGGSLNTNKPPNVRIGGRVPPSVGEPTAGIRPATGLGGDGRQRVSHVALLPRFSFQWSAAFRRGSQRSVVGHNGRCNAR